MLQNLITAAREKAGRSNKAARDLGVKIREAQEAKTATAELETQFDAALADAQKDIKELNRLQAEFDLETQATQMSTPREQFTGRTVHFDGNGEVAKARRDRHARRQAREMERQRVMFHRAGVETMEHFHKFKEAHSEAFLSFLTHGNAGAMKAIERHGFKPLEAMALLTTQDELGGFLVPDEIRNEVVKDLAGIAVMRRICRVERTGSSTLVFPSIQSATTDADVYTSGYTGNWKAEGYVTGGTAPPVQNQPRFGQARIPVHAWAPDAVELTQELIADSMADVEGIVAEVIAETLAMDEDAGFINGNGVGRPLGILNGMSGTSLTTIASGANDAITYDGVVDMFTGVPAQYRQNARWLLNSLTLGAVMKLKDSQNMPLFPVNAVPGTLLGKPMEFSELMPDIADATNPMIFGDFRYYCIADRQELRVQRLIERFAPNVGLLPTAREGGTILRTAAFRKMLVS